MYVRTAEVEGPGFRDDHRWFRVRACRGMHMTINDRRVICGKTNVRWQGVRGLAAEACCPWKLVSRQKRYYVQYAERIGGDEGKAACTGLTKAMSGCRRL